MADEHKGHRERLRKRVVNTGFEEMEPHEILEYVLTFSVPRGDTNIIGHRLIKEFGSLYQVFEAKAEDLIKVDGVGPKSAELITLIPQISRAYLSSRGCHKRITNQEEIYEHLKDRFIGINEEYVIMICLNAKSEVIYDRILFKGSIDRCSMNVRTIIDIALRVKALDVIIAHNHPNGFGLPSKADVRATAIIKKALDAVNVGLVDHIVVSSDGCVPIIGNGFIER